MTATATATATATISNIVTLQDFLGNVTQSQLETLKKALKGQTINEAHASFLKTENKAIGLVGAYAATFRAICQALAYGNKSGLKGLSLASKRQSGAFQALVSLGVCSPSGDVLLGVDQASKGKISEDAMLAHEMGFCAALWAARETQREASATAKKAAAAEKATANAVEVAKETIAAVEATLTTGQQHDAAVALVVGAIETGTLSNENMAALMAILAPHGIKAAPKVKATA